MTYSHRRRLSALEHSATDSEDAQTSIWILAAGCRLLFKQGFAPQAPGESRNAFEARMLEITPRQWTAMCKANPGHHLVAVRDAMRKIDAAPGNGAVRETEIDKLLALVEETPD